MHKPQEKAKKYYLDFLRDDLGTGKQVTDLVEVLRGRATRNTVVLRNEVIVRTSND